MDRLQKRLAEDARRIQADPGPELQERIRASLEATRPADRTPRPKATPGTSLWLASSLTGLAAALVIIAVLNTNGGVEPTTPTDIAPQPQINLSIQGFPLNTETAEWTAPLEQELENLQSDLEKA
ncbi:MAG: hypothetical protein ACE5FV_09820, partial [Woeseia sp.]